MSAVLKEDLALSDLRYYLRAWCRWVRAWRAPLGLPGAVNWVTHIIPTVSGGETISDEVDGEILHILDAEIESLPAMKRAAIRLTYLREEPGMAVFRSGRMTVLEAKRLCAEAEVEMIPRLRVRGVVLGGA